MSTTLLTPSSRPCAAKPTNDNSSQTAMSHDPLGYAGGDTNLYRYCGNDPTNATDPSGLASTRDSSGSSFGSSGSCSGSSGSNTGTPNITETVVPALPNGYWLVIATNPGQAFAGGGGHAWLAVINSNLRPPTVFARGFAPKTTPTPLTAPTPGELNDESKTKYATAMAIPITEVQYKKLVGEINKKQNTPGTYQIGSSNCAGWDVSMLNQLNLAYQIQRDNRDIADPLGDGTFISPSSLSNTLNNVPLNGTRLFRAP